MNDSTYTTCVTVQLPACFEMVAYLMLLEAAVEKKPKTAVYTNLWPIDVTIPSTCFNFIVNALTPTLRGDFILVLSILE